jgi:hypothetical protein
MAGSVSWQLNGTRATLRCGDLSATLDGRLPARGLYDVSLAGTTLADGQFLGLDIDATGEAVLADFYQRGGDLIARYAQTTQRVFAIVAYWRAGCLELNNASHPYVDLVVSVETSLLDSRPWLVATSKLSAALDRWVSAPAGYEVARLTHTALSYIEIRHPDDALTASLSTRGEQAELSTRLFGQPLEKGVILRSRLRGLFVPREGDETLARAALAQFAALPLPLTT